ncbi:hypothetical protein PF010_g22292 [Phytophthora fragariae]|uniref:BED-type domain-containing protein n=1 Tax=Phytophthora fragariae TaxID=53985 RepID=A0A6G0K9Q3_9STRA|nr:hypothetical protein PF010_g22292 [Phytophthora fragariae]KAE9206019.1 hypothetical protein PF004_g17416 [Phytophthora fragariae]
MSSIPPRSLAAVLIAPEEGDYFQCRLCFLRRKQTRGTGHTNLADHLHRCHATTYMDEFRSIQRREGSLDAFVKADEFARTVYNWLDWIIMENRELSMCEKPKTRKYTHLASDANVGGFSDFIFLYVSTRQTLRVAARSLTETCAAWFVCAVRF